MTVSSDRLGDAMKTFIDNMSDADKQDLQIVWRGIATTILNELTTNAVVTTDVSGTDYTGVIT